MSAKVRWFRCVVLAVLSASAWLAGCASTGGVGGGSPAAANETKDRVTASDEPEASKRARVRLDLATAYFGRGQMTVALDEVKLAIAADPTVAAAFNLRGLIYASLGDDRLAEESFRRALQLNARDADSMQNYAWYLCQQKRFAEANSMFEQALAVPQYRDAPRTLLAQGVCLARGGQWADAEHALQRAYELEPANPSTAVNLSEVLYRRGEHERARFFIRRVNAVADVANSQTLWLAARIENRLGNRQGVEEIGNQLRNRFPQSRETMAFERGQFDD
jgi:type IV pilus assembly protein PilF